MHEEDPEELLHLVALTLAPSVGPISARRLIGAFGTARAVFKQSAPHLEEVGGIGPGMTKALRNPDLFRQAERELSFMQKHSIGCKTIHHQDYPGLLSECADAPVVLYYKGSAGIHCTHRLSVVGTRKATAYGRDICRKLIGDLAARINDLVIVSGLAYGIDIMAHRSALEFGLPTIAVLGHGFSTLYPRAHRETARQIIAQGALVSDFPSGMPPERNNFLRRNRIIAGWSDITLVIESGESGGALITAHLAASYDRDVVAVPGRADDRRSKGCNALIIEEKARMVASAADILRVARWDGSGTAVKPVQSCPDTDLVTRKVFHLIEEIPGIHPEQITRHTGMPIHQVIALLTEWELLGWLSSDPGMRFRRRS